MPLSLDTCLPEDLPAALWQRAERRPTLSGAAQRVDSADGFFRAHWTDEGEDALPDAGAGVPPSVERALAALSAARVAYEAQGFRPVEPDSGYGGGEPVDVYFLAIDANGYARPARAEDPDAVSSCWIELEPALVDGPEGLLESVAAHELHHCVQFAYTVETHAWIYEATATWAQYQQVQSPDLQLLLDGLYVIRLAGADRPMATTDGRFEYAGLLLPRFFAERGADGLGQAADPAGVVTLWEALAESPRWREGLEQAALARWNIPLDRAFAEFSAWNAFACGRDDGMHYDPALLPCTVEGGLPIAEEQGDTITHTHEEATHTALYTAVEGPPGALQTVCVTEGDGAPEASALLLGLDAAGAWRAQAWGPADGRALHAAGERWVLLSASTGEDPATVRCEVASVEGVVAGGGCSTSRAPRGAWLGALLWFFRRRVC